MPALATLTASLTEAFNPPTTWADCGTKVGNAIDTYMISVAITTVVTGISVIGGEPSAYSGTGTMSAISPVGTGALLLNCGSSFITPTWVGIGSTIASAIITYVPTVVVTTKADIVAPTVAGGGTGSMILPPDPSFIVRMDALFTTPGNTWATLGTKMANMIATQFSTITLSTIDAGTVSGGAYTGAGIGTLIWS